VEQRRHRRTSAVSAALVVLVLAEQRLANLVQEVAVAAAVPPPRVLLINSKAANVGAAGLTMDDATVVVTQGFVRLPRDEQQAVIAHVMASVGNGDLTPRWVAGLWT
jgi:heat shock protein HtpX